uniref:Transcription factor CBF/NF-Y/archaeal histone domain-containing protein n=1 Tax=Ananas comosus var. bracteatus TaxID=296719 RepID=A0A6V7PBM7_ANACO|nr:unnamed protein product [Ananas comosus var. bracteatus]
MAIQERLLSLAAPLRHRGLVGGAAIVAAAAAAGYSLVHARAAPFGLGAVVAFFWPLLASTGLFLAAVAVLLRISPPPPPAPPPPARSSSTTSPEGPATTRRRRRPTPPPRRSAAAERIGWIRSTGVRCSESTWRSAIGGAVPCIISQWGGIVRNCCGGRVQRRRGRRRGSASSAREQDRFLPIANVSRIMKKALPANAKISKDAKETVQECVSEFISFVTGEASDKCQREKRKTINGDDLLWAMSTLGFEDYVEPLKVYLHKFREIEGERQGTASASASASAAQSHQLSLTKAMSVAVTAAGGCSRRWNDDDGPTTFVWV